MTANQLDLLTALRRDGAKLINMGEGLPVARWEVYQPGVPRPVYCPASQTVKACVRRGWLRFDGASSLCVISVKGCSALVGLPG